MAQFQVTQGTQTNLANDPVGTNVYPISKIDIGGAGASSLFTGTLGAITNLAGGTITALAKGTVSAGTINVGTIDTISQLPPNNWGTVVSTGTTALGTIKAAVSGSQIFVTDLIISVGSATTVVIGNGGTSTPLVGTLSLNQYGGIAMPFRIPLATTAGSALTYQQSVGCPMTITAQGFVR